MNILQLDHLNLDAGHLCLDFANTAEWHASDQPDEKLKGYSDLVGWAQQAGLITELQASKFLQEGARHPAESIATLQKAINFREAVYRVFSAIAHRQAPNAADLVILNQVLLEALAQVQIVQTPDGFGWGWNYCEEALDWMLWPVAKSAAELLTSGELARVGECADDRGCGYLFFDTSRNRSRRWCDMKSCGNRAKAKQHYRRQQSE